MTAWKMDPTNENENEEHATRRSIRPSSLHAQHAATKAPNNVTNDFLLLLSRIASSKIQKREQ
jgi:hypothetical protein